LRFKFTLDNGSRPHPVAQVGRGVRMASGAPRWPNVGCPRSWINLAAQIRLREGRYPPSPSDAGTHPLTTYASGDDRGPAGLGARSGCCCVLCLPMPREKLADPPGRMATWRATSASQARGSMSLSLAVYAARRTMPSGSGRDWSFARACSPSSGHWPSSIRHSLASL
jgi:hypothetical protein